MEWMLLYAQSIFAFMSDTIANPLRFVVAQNDGAKLQ
jgi:hypothetical protein